MQNEMNENKVKTGGRKRAAVIAVIVCMLAVLATGTMAYFTAEETAYNVITTGNLSMRLYDEATLGEPFPDEGVFGVLPESDVWKLVYLENSGNVDFFARISLEKIIVAAEGVEEELNFDYITLDLNTTDWIEKDGYYYYKRALAPGEQTEKLFTKVTFGPELGNEYMDAHIEIIVNAQAVQSKNNGDDPLTAVGWPSSKDAATPPEAENENDETI